MTRAPSAALHSPQPRPIGHHSGVANRHGAWAVALAIVLAACSSSAKQASVTTGDPPSSSARAGSGSMLGFREVLGRIPYGNTSDAVGTTSCRGGRATTAAIADRRAVLADATKSSCYLLDPTLVTGEHVGSADAVVNETTASWEVNLHFTNDDFVRKVASVEVGKQIAIVLDGVVVSAPTINPGITGQDVTISGAFDEASARRIAAKIDPSSASRVPETSTTTATEGLVQSFSKRCRDVGPRLGFNGSISGATISTVDMIRSGYARAHQPVPADLADLDGKQQIALCYFANSDASPGTSPTTMCPNGDRAEVGPAAPEVMFVVDENLKAFRFPGMQYLLPTGLSAPTAPDPCAGLGAP